MIVASYFFLPFLLFSMQGRQTAAIETGMQMVEIKILIVLCYFIGTGVFGFFVIALRYWQNSRPSEDFGAYFACESLGKECDRSAIDRNVSNQVLYDILQMIFGSFPAVNLLYGINIREIREKWQHYRYSAATRLTI